MSLETMVDNIARRAAASLVPMLGVKLQWPGSLNAESQRIRRSLRTLAGAGREGVTRRGAQKEVVSISNSIAIWMGQKKAGTPYCAKVTVFKRFCQCFECVPRGPSNTTIIIYVSS